MPSKPYLFLQYKLATARRPVYFSSSWLPSPRLELRTWPVTVGVQFESLYALPPPPPPKKGGGWDSPASLGRRLGVPPDWSGWCGEHNSLGRPKLPWSCSALIRRRRRRCGEHNFCPCWELNPKSTLVSVFSQLFAVTVWSQFTCSCAIFMLVKIHIVILWVMTPCSMAGKYQHFTAPIFRAEDDSSMYLP
jgi:hypothetical protein